LHCRETQLSEHQPIAALYEQGRISHVGVLPELEDELLSNISEGQSPDRLDALVWAITELMLARRVEPRVGVV
jgi:phage terminase large subunit-like protein